MAIRVYKFLEKQFALKTLYERRLKISKLSELNDPFDVMPFDLSDPRLHKALYETRRQIGEKRGLVCFSAKVSDPVIWAHYSAKHAGICLGFDLPGPEKPTHTTPVRYIENPLKFPSNFIELDLAAKNDVMQDMLFVKFKHWAYEEEIRVWAEVTDEEDGICYADFDQNVAKLVEVILGANCTAPKKAIERVLKMGNFQGVQIRRMRPAPKGFCMEDDPDWKD